MLPVAFGDTKCISMPAARVPKMVGLPGVRKWLEMARVSSWLYITHLFQTIIVHGLCVSGFGGCCKAESCVLWTRELMLQYLID